MTEYEESDIDYITGQLDGILLTALLEHSGDLDFDEEKWQDLYGADVTYNTFPAYPSKEAIREGEVPLDIMDWDDDREVATLKPDAEVPTDRTGSMVFEDGTVVTNRGGEKSMYNLSDTIYQLVARLRDLRLKIIRDVYDYSPDNHRR